MSQSLPNIISQAIQSEKYPKSSLLGKFSKRFTESQNSEDDYYLTKEQMRKMRIAEKQQKLKDVKNQVNDYYGYKGEPRENDRPGYRNLLNDDELVFNNKYSNDSVVDKYEEGEYGKRIQYDQLLDQDKYNTFVRENSNKFKTKEIPKNRWEKNPEKAQELKRKFKSKFPDCYIHIVEFSGTIKSQMQAGLLSEHLKNEGFNVYYTTPYDPRHFRIDNSKVVMRIFVYELFGEMNITSFANNSKIIKDLNSAYCLRKDRSLSNLLSTNHLNIILYNGIINTKDQRLSYFDEDIVQRTTQMIDMNHSSKVLTDKMSYAVYDRMEFLYERSKSKNKKNNYQTEYRSSNGKVIDFDSNKKPTMKTFNFNPNTFASPNQMMNPSAPQIYMYPGAPIPNQPQQFINPNQIPYFPQQQQQIQFMNNQQQIQQQQPTYSNQTMYPYYNQKQNPSKETSSFNNDFNYYNNSDDSNEYEYIDSEKENENNIGTNPFE